ncbi:MAG TPA: hypothetical protein VHR88_09895 [Solirubrobacteraceae bacterium]|jgi:hypothetical protein|nr:hypothetical protein [Solirubrobacteraceae bacterium]
MGLENGAELAAVLDEGDRLGLVFARHAYGMRAWVDLFSQRVSGIDDPERKALVATLVADNARHMLLFRERARAHGVDPDAYAAPDEGEVIYERIEELTDLDELVGYALGSLDHFDQLLAVYRAAAAGEDAQTIDRVRADVDRMLASLRPLGGATADRLAAEAHERYRVRELVETPRYVHGG